MIMLSCLVVEDSNGISERVDSEERQQIQDALKDGQAWLDSHPEADTEDNVFQNDPKHAFES